MGLTVRSMVIEDGQAKGGRLEDGQAKGVRESMSIQKQEKR